MKRTIIEVRNKDTNELILKKELKDAPKITFNESARHWKIARKVYPTDSFSIRVYDEYDIG